MLQTVDIYLLACWNYNFMGLFSPDPSDELLQWLCCTLKELLRSYGSCKLLQILRTPADPTEFFK
jgi:hypothetical protein